MINKAQALKMFDDGLIDQVTNNIRRYGKVLSDDRFTETEGFYAGETRYTTFAWHGMKWEVIMRNGELVAISREPE